MRLPAWLYHDYRGFLFFLRCIQRFSGRFYFCDFSLIHRLMVPSTTTVPSSRVALTVTGRLPGFQSSGLASAVAVMSVVALAV